LIHHRGRPCRRWWDEGLVTTRIDPAVSGSLRGHPGKEQSSHGRSTNLPKGPDRGDSMISSRTTGREGHLDQPISKDVSVARGLLDREALLQTLDRAVTKRITVISAPAGSGTTSLLRTWADRSTDVGRIA